MLIVCCVFLLGCASAKPQAKVSDLRAGAERAEANGRAAYARRNWAGAARDFQRAADCFGALDDCAAAAAARHNAGEALFQAGQISPAVAAYQQALTLNQRLAQKVAQAENLDGLAQCYRASGDQARALEALEESLGLAAGDKAVAATLANDLALVLIERGQAGDQARIMALLAGALETNESLKNAAGIAASHLNLGRADLHFGALDQADKDLHQALAEYRVLDDPLGLAYTHAALANLCVARQQPDQARLHREQAAKTFAILGVHVGGR